MYSPFTKTPLSAAKKRNKVLFPASPRTPGSQNCSFGRSFTNSFIQETANYVIEQYGCPLPVLVTEALTIAEKISDISVKLEPFGYASLVCGRQLLIWKYKLDCDNAHCRELTLPPSDLAHKADLVHLFLTDDSKLPSALAVSPEGHVRYWPNINHEGSSVDAVTDLQGQECYSLTSVFKFDIQWTFRPFHYRWDYSYPRLTLLSFHPVVKGLKKPLGCILSTTTSSLVIITPTIGDGQPSVICRTLTLPLGVLAGIGRRVSSFIFGPVPTQTTETKQLNRVLSVKCSDDKYILYVLSSSTVQKWYVSRKDRKENSDQLIFEADLDRELKQSYADEVFKKDSCLLSGLKTWCLDMQIYLSGVMILTAGTTHSGADSNIHYALGILDTSSDLPPQSFSSFRIIDYSQRYEEEFEEKLLNYKLICPTATSSSAFIFNSEKILSIQIGTHLELNEMDFKSSANLILGSGTCDGLPLFFTMANGVISFAPSQKSIGDSRIISSMREVSFKEPESSESAENLAALLRNAMCSYCTGDIEKCEKLIKEILPKTVSYGSSELDDAVVTLSLGIIDDYPVADPRWSESVPTDSVSSSLIISYQLEDKLKAHEYLLNFLKAFDLFDRLTTSKIGDVIIPTNVLLCEHAEKLVAAKAVRLFLTDHHELIESAVRDSLDKRGIEVKNHLTPQDVFFREVSSFHTIFPSLIEWEMEGLYEDESLNKILNVVMTVNKIYVGLLDAITEYREKNGDMYEFQKNTYNGVYLPWTGRDGNTGIRHLIQKQLFVNLDYTLKLTDSIQIQGVLYQQYVDILNFYLASYKSQLDSLKSDKKAPLLKEYEKERATFIKPLLAVEQYERAAAIAEKYLDFDILIQICEETQSRDRLQRYMMQFSEQKFCEFVFKWYLNKGQRDKIFKHLGQKQELRDFLQPHDNLKWIQDIQEEQYESAHVTLKQLALKETEYLNRKKTMLSWSKLASLVSDIPEDTKRHQIEGINREQDLIIHQEALPVSTVEAFGLDPSNMRVFPPEDLIEMYITDENASANAYDFKIALDILNFMKKPLSDPEVNNLRIHIWCKAILKDNWEEMDTNNPLEAIKETIFFQIIELAFDQGVDMHEFIPDVEELLQSPELSELADNPSFKFLIQAGYEHVMKIID